MKGASASAPANEFMDSLNMLARERRIDREMLLSAVEAALVAAYKRNYATGTDNVLSLIHI